MKKRIIIFLTFVFIFVMTFAGAEDWDEDEFAGDGIEFDDLDDFEEYDDFEDYEDFADFDDIGTEEEYLEALEENGDGTGSDQVADQSTAEYKEKVQRMSEISGYNDPDLKTDGDYAYYVSEDNTYCITSLYKGSSTDVVVPSSLGGYPVKIIGDHTFENKSFIRTVEVPDGVVAIGKQAFFMCINLQTVIVPEGVVMFGDQCFAACYMLDYVQVPDSLESVGEMAFLGCYALKEIEFGENLKSIGSCAFHTCTELEKVTVPSTSVTIDESAFISCPDNMEVIYLNKL